MSVWLLHLTLSREEEEQIQQRTHLPLPFEGLPDLSVISSQRECMHLLRALHPNDSPESLTLKLDRIWNQFSNLHLEDIIAVPLLLSGKLALAKISGHYTYDVSMKGDDVHTIPVTWYPRLETLRSFRRNKSTLTAGTHRLVMITDQTLSRAIYQRLPYKYNRFAKMRWIMIIFLIIAQMRLIMRLTGHDAP